MTRRGGASSLTHPLHPHTIVDGETRKQALAAAERLALWLRSTDLRGYDPYDGLRSPFVARLARGRRSRQLAIQALRRLPVNARPLLGIQPYENAKGTAVIASAAARLFAATGETAWRTLANEAADRAARLAIRDSDEACWGYPFDVQLRWGFYAAGTPNVIATVFTARSLLEVADTLGRPDLAELSGRAAPFLDRLSFAKGAERLFAYVPGNSTPIHNANLLAAALRAELAARQGGEIPAHVLGALDFSVCRQRADGSWPYGEGPGLGWVDGFHTAYMLSALADLRALTRLHELSRALSRGTAFYVDHLFDRDGAPRYYKGSRYPLDSHNAASAISTLLRLGEYDPRAPQLGIRVLRFALTRLQTRRGWFLYQRLRLHSKWVPFTRWSDAHMLSALAEVVRRG